VLMTVVDRLTKFLVLIPTITEFKASTVAKLFMDNVVKRFGFPLSIVSDRDPRFVGDLWKGLMIQAGVRRKMSSAAHPQTDGVTEQANRTIASMARSYIENHPETWASHLPALEIAYNDSVNASTGYSPYFLCSGTNPVLPLSLYAAPTFETASTVDKSVRKFVGKMQANVVLARKAMLQAQARQVKYANRSRRDYVFAVGDRVIISEGHFKESAGSNLAQADKSTKKLNALFRGPFKVSEVISKVAYRLELPEYMIRGRTHNAFHVSRLRPYLTTDIFPARAAREAVPEAQKEGDGKHFEIDGFFGHRLVGKGGKHLQVLVQYKGYREKEWQYVQDLAAPPGLSVTFYFELLTKYAATDPRGSGTSGKPPNPAQRQQLVIRLEAELRRAEWSAGEERKKQAEIRSDTYRTEAAERANLNDAKPKKKKKLEEHDGSVEDDTLLKGGRIDATTRRSHRDSTRSARKLQDQPMFEGSKKRNATDGKSGGASETKKPIIKEAPETARRSARLAGVPRR
jgi:hypothetical protein